MTNQIALVTGGSSGIGRAIAIALAKNGVRLFICGRDHEKLDTTVQLIQAVNAVVSAEACNLSEDASLAKLSRTIERESDRLDILVHCAGAIGYGPLATAPIASFDEQWRTNVRAPLLLTQMLLPLLKKPRGQVVFINSIAGLEPAANRGHFSMTQAATKMLADTLRIEVNTDNVRVLSVFPARSATPRIKALYEKEGRPYKPQLLLQPEDTASVVVNALMQPWTAEVTNISIRPMIKP